MRSVNSAKPSRGFRTVLLAFCLLSPVFCLLPAPAWAVQSCAQSGGFTIDNRPGVGTLTGSVVGVDAQGKAQGSLAGATVSVSGVGSVTTNSQGGYTFQNVQEGTYAVTVSKSEYLPAFKDVTLRAGETKSEAFTLTAQSTSGAPVTSNFSSPNGKHFIEGMPGSLTFSTEVTWNGTPGSVQFYVAGTWYPATIQDLGGGKARATLTIAAPSVIGTCRELTIEVTNGAGKKVYVNTGVHFSPVPGIVIPWYRDNIPWTPSGLALSWSDEQSINWDLPLKTGDVELGAFVGFSRELKYDLLSAQFSGSVGGSGGFGIEWPVAQVKILGEGGLNLTGSLDISFAGCNAPVIIPSWNAGFEGKAGVEAPAVLVVDVIFPPAAPTVHYLLTVPGVKQVVGALKLRLYVIGGAGLSGQYQPGQPSQCFLGATSLSVTGTIGLEGQVALKLAGAESGVYVGGTGTPEFQICPDWKFEAVTLRAYVGVFASAWLFQYKQEVGAEIRFDSGGQATMFKAAPLSGGTAVVAWEPVGADLSKWGEANRLVGVGDVSLRKTLNGTRNGGTAEEELLLENVIKIGSPSAVADASETLITYSAFDSAKPWYESTDIGTLRQISGGAWNVDRISDDNDAEFNPSLAEVDEATNWAAWERVSGDVSEATGPEDVAPHLEIVTARFDRVAGTWSEPIQITSNTALDRDPLPVLFGDKQGVMWIQNEAGASPGDATSGDSLLFAEWSGTEYLAPLTLWSGQKGILSLSFAADTAGEGYVVFAVDEDGDADTKVDRELYAASTIEGAWQAATRLTDDTTEDAVPVLIAVNGMPVCVWSAGGTVSYTTLNEWDPKAVYAEYTTANEAVSLDGVALPGGAVIAYTVQGPEGVDIVASFYDATLDKWSLPRQLTHDEHAESALSLACDGTGLVIAYLKTQTERNNVDVEIDGVVHHLQNVPQPARTDLYVLRHTLGNDLAVAADSVIVDPPNPTPGGAVTLRARVENRGELAMEDVEVAFYDGDPNNGGTIIEEIQVIPGLLVGGASREVAIAWGIPASGSTGEVYVIVDPSLLLEDRDRSNNAAAIWTMLPDLTVERGWYHDVSQESVALTARVVNSGAVAGEASVLSWRLGSADGPEIGQSLVEPMPAGGAFEVTYVWDTQGFTPGEFLAVAAVSDATDLVQEWSETNNAALLAVRIPSPPTFVGPDFDKDGDVDTDDFAIFEGCASGPGIPLALDCEASDFDADNDVDQADFAIFQRCFSGEDIAADPNCSQ